MNRKAGKQSKDFKIGFCKQKAIDTILRNYATPQKKCIALKRNSKSLSDYFFKT